MMQPDEIDGSAIFEDPDAELRGLLGELEEAEAQWRIAETTGGDVERWRQVHRAVREKIDPTPALGQEGIRAKARAVNVGAVYAE